MDRRVALAGGLRDHLNAGVKNFLAGQHEARLSAAEERREELAEIDIDRVEGLLQEVARLAVDLTDRGLEGGHGLGQVQSLRIEILFALVRLLELVERREIH